MPHNIDRHSATGALGGGALTHVNPGEQVVLRWTATRPLRLSLRPGRHDPLARRLRHARHRDGIAA
jgi:hypothetical protein